jgi:hypothetical protein
MTHAWGGSPEDEIDPIEFGANTGLLTDNTLDCDYFSAMPRMSTIPVKVRLIEKRSTIERSINDKHTQPAA